MTRDPAFIAQKPPEYWGDPAHGMTLRDWFAGMFGTAILSDLDMMRAIRSTKDEGRPNDEVLAEQAYDYADAMLKRRSKLL